jgi:hypothetical protein
MNSKSAGCYDRRSASRENDDRYGRGSAFFHTFGGEPMNLAERLIAHPLVVLLLLALAAFLEAFGDSFFQIGMHRSAGFARVAAFGAGVAVLAAYGSVINLPRWDFGRLIGVYVAVFFVMAQVLNKVRFGQNPSLPVCVGGALVVVGGLLMALWKG